MIPEIQEASWSQSSGRGGMAWPLLRYSSLMASLFPLRGFNCPPRLFTVEVGIVVMLNCQYTRGSIGATPERWPSATQPTRDINLNRDVIEAGQNPNWAQTSGDGCSRLSKSCSQQKAAK
jgi:hypothetical protein